MNTRAKNSLGAKIAAFAMALVSFISFGLRQFGEFTDGPRWLIFVEIAGLVAFVILIGALLGAHRRRQLKSRVKRAVVRCPLCGLDPSIDDHDAPPNAKRCIECGRVMREERQ